MAAAEIKTRCEALVQEMERATAELNALIPHLALRADERAAEEAVLYLGWVAATCTMLGVHAGNQNEERAVGTGAQ